MNSTSSNQPRQLPIRPRPTTGETTPSYIRRLARANHLRPNYLRRCLRDPGHGELRLDWLATMAGRPVASLEHALADAGHRPPHPLPASKRKADKTILFAAIRADAYERGLPIRGIADRHGVHRRTVIQALASPIPRPRKTPTRKSRLDPFKDTIDDILRQDLGKPYRTRRTAKHILDELISQHELTKMISYSTVRDYVAYRRSTLQPRPLPTSAADIPHAESSPAPRRNPNLAWTSAHHAVEHQDLPRLRTLINAGHDVEGDDGNGWTLLRHAIDVEHNNHLQTGRPLHATVTAFLLARGADPLRRHNGTPLIEDAETRGHWLAAEIMRGWINQGQHPSPS
jgi:hypothetical protein